MTNQNPPLEKTSPTLEDKIRALYIRQVHVDELGYFSNCDPWCDDCFFFLP